MNCAICEKFFCCHGINTVLGPTWRCDKCGAIGINGPAPTHCLPMYEGRVTIKSDVFSSVCPECYNREVKNI